MLLLICSLAVSGWLVTIRQYVPVDPNDQTLIEVRLPENSSARQVASLLKQNGLIRSETFFLGYLYQKGMDKQLKAGLYAFSRSQSIPELAWQISQGKVENITFTVPEGYTVKQIGDLLIDKQVCTEQQWTDAVQASYEYDFLLPDQSGEQRLEGFLFPDTYIVDAQTSAQDIIRMMLERFHTVWTNDYAAEAESKNQSLRNTVIIASLIEREARVAEEREIISGVIYNRLQKGMPLQIDATVQYALGEHRDTVSYQDLTIDSPYNTYQHTGLPPGPIASPGRAAIEAALNPAKNNYYYYVAKGDGSHYFSSTYAEHLAAMQKYGL